MSRITVKGLWAVLKDAGSGVMKDKVPKLSASLAYYTLFSIGPMLIVIIYHANIFYGKDAIKGRLFGEIRENSAIAIPANTDIMITFN
jgi:membrane protein